MNRAAAIEVLRRVAEALARGPGEDERERLLLLHDEALRVLARSAYRPGTPVIVQRIAMLEHQMRHFAPGDRARAICERLGLSRAAYYRYRAQSRNTLGLICGPIYPSDTECTNGKQLRSAR